MSLSRWLAPLMILLALAAPAFAEAVNDDGSDAEQVTAPPPPPPRVAPKRRARRRVAAVETDRTADRLQADGEFPAARERRIDFTGGITAGYSGLSGTPTAGSSAVLASNGYHHPSLGLGAVADLRAMKYLGVEGEGFLGLRSVNNDPTTSSTVSRSITGFALDVKGQYPIVAGVSTTITPKAGIGYGWTQLIESTNAGTPGERSSVTRMTGFYAIGGVDFVPYRDWLVSVDYLHNFTADGGVPNAANPSTSLQSVVAGNYDRLRAGVFYRFAPHFVAGAQYVRRSYDFGLASSSVMSTTTTTFTPTATDGRVLHLDQALATFLFEL